MKKFLIVAAFLFSACDSTAAALPTSTPTVIPTLAFTQTPSPSPTPSIPTFTPAPESAVDDHPVFLAWPLPPTIGLARISQYPNTPWTWNYLGLNEGVQCPPMFGFLESSYEYWRDSSIPYEQDRAQADPHNFQMIACYTTGAIEGKRGHEGTDIKAPADTPVYAAADGKIAGWRLNGLNTMLVLRHCLGGAWDAQNECAGVKWYTTYMHIVTDKNLLARNLDVRQGDQVATIYNQGDNSHLHFEVGLNERDYANFVNPWGGDEAPWLGCMWLDQSLCPFPDPEANRAAFLFDSTLRIKQGGIDILIRDIPKVRKVRLYKDRLALMDSQGRLFLREGIFNAAEDSVRNWILFAEQISDFEITDGRAAILDLGGNLLVNETNQSSGWIPLAGGVRAFSVSSQRVGFLDKNGALYVKEGDLKKEWILLMRDVFAFQLTDNRVAVLGLPGNLLVNEGGLDEEWRPMAERVRAFQITNLRMGVLDAENNLLVKEGNLRAEFVQIAQNVRGFQLSNYRLLLQSADGTRQYQTGNLYQPLTELALPEDLPDVFLNDLMPVYLP